MAANVARYGEISEAAILRGGGASTGGGYGGGQSRQPAPVSRSNDLDDDIPF